MDTTTIRIKTPEELLAVLPYRLGFRPRDSVVLLGMSGPRNRLGLVSRVDLGDIGHPEVGPRLLGQMSQLMAQDGAEDVFVVLYSDLPRRELAGDPIVRGALDHLRVLTDWAEPPGPWVVGSQTYGCWGEGEQCAPGTGDVAELSRGSVAATMVLHGLTVVEEREALGVARTADAGRRRSATRAARQARHRRSELRARSGGGATLPGAAFGFPGAVPAVDQRQMHEWRAAERARWDRLVDLARRGAELPAAELGRLAEGLEDNTVRDGVLVAMIREQPPGVVDAASAERTLDLVMGPEGVAPEEERVEPAAAVLRALVACAPRRPGALALGLLAWLAWWQGDGARADVLATQALAVRPGTRLAELIDQALAARIPPGWVQAAAGGDSATTGTSIR